MVWRFSDPPISCSWSQSQAGQSRAEPRASATLLQPFPASHGARTIAASRNAGRRTGTAVPPAGNLVPGYGASTISSARSADGLAGSAAPPAG